MWAFERRWAEAIFSSFAPEQSSGLAPRPGEVDYMATFHSMRERARLVARLGLRAALWMVALSPLWLAHRARSFARLPLAERQLLLAQLMEHRVFAIREAAFLLKLVACLALFASDEVRARSGYDGVPDDLHSLSRRSLSRRAGRR